MDLKGVSMKHIISLLLLFVLNPSNEFTLCILHNLGFNHCFGCGLGKSIHYFLNFNYLCISRVLLKVLFLFQNFFRLNYFLHLDRFVNHIIP